MPASKSATNRLTVVVAAYDDLLVHAAIEFRAKMKQQRLDWDVMIVDVSQAIAPGQPATDQRGVHRLVMDPAIRIIADPPLRSSALLADWLDVNVGNEQESLLILPADGGIAHFAVAQRAQGIATRRSRIGVYLTSAPAIASIGTDQLLSDVRVLELGATTQKCIARADVLLARDHAESTLAQLGWRTPYTLVRDIDAEGLFELTARLDALPPPVVQLQSMPFVSVCITHHERPALLAQTLASIREQSYPSFEVILVDDGSSSPEAIAMLDSLEKEFAERGWKIVRQANRYLGAARNAAVRASQGELLLFIDDDDCMRDGYIAQFVRAAEATGADVVTCFLEYFEGTSAPSASTRVHHRWVMPGPIGAGTLLHNTFGGANGLVSRAAYDMVGGYTEDHGVGFEDWEFYNRLLAKGARFEVLPRPLLWCRWGIGGMQATAQKQVQQKTRAIRPAREAMPHAWRELPALVQGLHERNRELQSRVQKLEQQLAVAGRPAAGVPDETSSTVTPSTHIPTELPAIIGASDLTRRRCHVWHTEGLGLSGILSWMWRLRDHFAPQMNMEVRLVDLAVLPYGFQQAGADPSTFYDERIGTSQEFLAFLRRTANDVHVVNHAFPYLRSLVEQLGSEVLRGLRLVGVCHTDQEYYYSNLEQLAPVLRSIIAVSPVGSSRVDLQACKLEYSIVSPK